MSDAFPLETALTAAAYVVFAGAALALIRSDIREHRLPNAIVLPATFAVAALLAGASWAGGDPAAMMRAIVGALALGSFYLALWGVGRRRGGMGGGDVKLAVLVGLFLAWHGWAALALGSAAAFVLGGGVAVALLVRRRATSRTRIPFAPYMLLGACLGALLA